MQFETERAKIENKYDLDNENDEEELLRTQLNKKGSFYIPKDARWGEIRKLENSNSLNEALDNAMNLIEEENPRLEGRLPQRYRQSKVKESSLEGLMDEFEKIDVRGDGTDSDFVGRIYEYFVKQFALRQAQGSGEFYTPQDVVEVLVESLKPLEGRVFDPCAGTGGMFVQSYDYAERKEGYDGKKLTFYGQEISNASVSLAEMNMFLRSLSDSVTIKEGDSLLNDRMPECVDGDRLNADKVITNPPFNYDYKPDKIDNDDPRFPYGLPNKGNANYAFIQHMLYHTAEGGMVGTVMANGALANDSDKDIREQLVDNDLVDAVITLPDDLFYTVSIPVSIFIFSKGKGEHNDGHRNRENETLFIDASDLYESVSRSENRLTEEHVERIAMTVRKYRGDVEGEIDKNEYMDVEEFCKVATSEEIAETNYNLNPGRYISFNTDTDHTPLDVRLPELRGQIEAKFKQSRELESNIMNQLSNLEQNQGDKQ
jgi:type I restriction enzyme M protein